MTLKNSGPADIGARIRALVEHGLREKGVSARRASIDVVGHDGLIRDIRAGRMPSADRLIALFDYLGVSADPEEGALATVTGFAEATARAIEPSMDGSPEALRQGFLPIPYHRADLAHRGVAPVAFARAWLDAQGLNPEALSVLSVVGDEMAPTLPPGALALIDAKAERVGHAIWAYSDKGGSRIARVVWSGPETAMLTFDAPGRAPILKSGADLRATAFHGRVVWLGAALTPP